MNRDELQNPLVQRAIGWMVQLRSGEAGLEEQQAFQAWRRQSQEHEGVCQRIEHFLGGFPDVSAPANCREQLRQTLLNRRSS